MLTDEKGGMATITIPNVIQSNGVITGCQRRLDAELIHSLSLVCYRKGVPERTPFLRSTILDCQPSLRCGMPHDDGRIRMEATVVVGSFEQVAHPREVGYKFDRYLDLIFLQYWLTPSAGDAQPRNPA